MKPRNITWQQTVILVACLASTLAAYKWLGPEAVGVVAVVSSVVNFMLGRGDARQAAILMIGTCAIVGGGLGVACGSQISDAGQREIVDHAASLAKCRAEGRDAGHYEAYQACKHDAGIE